MNASFHKLAKHTAENRKKNEGEKVRQLDGDKEYKTLRYGKLVYDIPDAEPLFPSDSDTNGGRKRFVTEYDETTFSYDKIPYEGDERTPDVVNCKTTVSTKRVIRSIASTLWGFGFMEVERVG